MFIKVFYLVKARLIVCLSIICRFNDLVKRETTFRVLIREVVNALND